MKKLSLQLLMVTAVTMFVMAAGPTLHAQQADQDPAPASPHQPQAATPQQPNEAQVPASGDFTTHETKTFSGRIIKEGGKLVLKDPVTKVSYKLDDPSKAKQYMGKQVKINGKLDMSTNTIRVENIEPIS